MVMNLLSSRFHAIVGLMGTAVIPLVQVEIAIALPASVNSIAQQVTVRIDGANTGSGVIINRQSNTYTVLTNWHVVAPGGNYTLQTYDGKTYQVSRSAMKRIGNLDLAELQFTSTENYRKADLYLDQLTAGTTAYISGWADPDAVSVTREYVIIPQIITRVVQKPKDEYSLVFSTPIKPGMSGGPVLDEQGRLLGIHGQARIDVRTETTDFLGIPINTYTRLASVKPATPIQSATTGQPRPTSPVSTAARLDNSKELIDEVWQLINRQYIDDTFNKTDWQAVRKEYLNKSYSNKQQAYQSIKEMVKKLDDPYTYFMEPAEFKKTQVDNSGELIGVGITIGQDEKTKQLFVIVPIEDTPAFKAGILAKDTILKINGKSTQGMDTNQAVSLIRGEPGTTVNLTIQRNGQIKQFAIKRTRIEIKPVRYNQQQTPVGNLGYIRLKQFSANAGKEMQNAIKDLENKRVAGYILDLRGNPGGLLYSSIEIARMWLNQGTIVSTVDRKGETEKEVANGRALTNKPLVILVDNASSSATEILSGALQDNKRAVLVGSRTFGKATVQSLRPLEDGSGLAVTIAKYYTPKGKNIEKQGITPDVIVNLSNEQKQDLWANQQEKIGTLLDPQFIKAVETLGKQIAAK
jgi:carboxyl-terminal processing protease